jgi:hypothetical protein
MCLELWTRLCQDVLCQVGGGGDDNKGVLQLHVYRDNRCQARVYELTHWLFDSKPVDRSIPTGGRRGRDGRKGWRE